MKLFGHDTSPYVRRIRILLQELGVSFERDKHGWQDPSPEFLRVSPTGRVPALSVAQPAGELVLLDSTTIADFLLTHHAPPARADSKALPFQPTLFHVAHRYEDETVLTLIDTALDGGIQTFMYSKDGVDAKSASTLQRQAMRVEKCLSALDKIYSKRASLHDGVFGYVDVAVATSIDWFRFRNVIDISAHTNLASFFEQNRSRPSLATTDPRIES